MTRKKLYYVPGIISLVILPVLMVYFDLERPKEKTCLHLFVPSDDTSTAEKYSKGYIEDVLKHKKRQIISFADPGYDDRSTFVYNSNREFIVDELRRFRFTYDTTRVLEFRFMSDDYYGDFVWIINLTALLDIKRFAWIDNSIFFLSNPPPVYQQSEVFDIDPVEAVIIPGYEPPTRWEIFWEDAKVWFQMIWYYVRMHYITVTAFILLIVFPSIYYIRRRKMAARLISA